MVFTDEVTPPPAGTTNPPNPPQNADPVVIDHRTIPPVPPALSINLVDMEALSFEHYSLTKTSSPPSEFLSSA